MYDILTESAAAASNYHDCKSSWSDAGLVSVRLEHGSSHSASCQFQQKSAW